MKKEYKEYLILSILTIFVFIVSIVAMATKDVIVAEEPTILEDEVIDEVVTEVEDTDVVEVVEDEPLEVESFTGLIIGFDVSGDLTDILMVGYYDVELDEIKIINVPRDFLIDFSEEPFKTIKEEDPNNHISYCKLTEVYYMLGNTEDALQQIKKIVSAIIGIDIEYMAAVHVGGFKDVVDAVGGVDFYVPQRMYYRDDAQDLLINLYEGQQLLDGDHAEQLVRFRQYRMGDIDRIAVQQDFMVALYEKIRTIRDFDQLMTLVQIANDSVDSNFGLAVMLDYTHYFFEMDPDNLLNTENMLIPPSWAVEIDEKVYQDWSKSKVKELVQELINPTIVEVEEDSQE